MYQQYYTSTVVDNIGLLVVNYILINVELVGTISFIITGRIIVCKWQTPIHCGTWPWHSLSEPSFATLPECSGHSTHRQRMSWSHNHSEASQRPKAWRPPHRSSPTIPQQGSRRRARPSAPCCSRQSVGWHSSARRRRGSRSDAMAPTPTSARTTLWTSTKSLVGMLGRSRLVPWRNLGLLLEISCLTPFPMLVCKAKKKKIKGSFSN